MTDEILSYLPDYRGKKVLLLGITSCKFTENLAERANHVTSVSVQQDEVNTAKDSSKHPMNVTFTSADIAQLHFPECSFDIVISNSFFNQREDDDELTRVLADILVWLVPGGYYFLVEPSAALNTLPAKRNDLFISRTHTQYCHLILKTAAAKSAFQILRGKNLLASTDESGRYNQVCFLARRGTRDTGDISLTEMDIRYSEVFIHKLEWIFGHTWVSTGGEATTRHFCGRLGLSPGLKVLDVGCGTGGSAFFMARHYGVHVLGVDISTNMINIALQRMGYCESGLRRKLQFEIQDVSETDYPENSFDVVYSRDCILHIQDKLKLFTKIHKWLKPGGILFSTDYCRGTGNISQEYLEYEKKSCSSFQTVASYGSILQSVGFKDVKAEDLADTFYRIQKEELEAFLPTKEAFVEDYSLQEFEALAKIASNKLPWVKSQQFTWGAFMARK